MKFFPSLPLKLQVFGFRDVHNIVNFYFLENFQIKATYLPICYRHNWSKDFSILSDILDI